MHVVAATFIGNAPDAPFAALYSGGGWHEVFYMYFRQQENLSIKRY
jgi:hypothetical protein